MMKSTIMVVTVARAMELFNEETRGLIVTHWQMMTNKNGNYFVVYTVQEIETM